MVERMIVRSSRARRIPFCPVATRPRNRPKTASPRYRTNWPLPRRRTRSKHPDVQRLRDDPAAARREAAAARESPAPDQASQLEETLPTGS